MFFFFVIFNIIKSTTIDNCLYSVFLLVARNVLLTRPLSQSFVALIKKAFLKIKWGSVPGINETEKNMKYYLNYVINNFDLELPDVKINVVNHHSLHTTLLLSKNSINIWRDCSFVCARHELKLISGQTKTVPVIIFLTRFKFRVIGVGVCIWKYGKQINVHIFINCDVTIRVRNFTERWRLFMEKKFNKSNTCWRAR